MRCAFLELLVAPALVASLAFPLASPAQPAGQDRPQQSSPGAQASPELRRHHAMRGVMADMAQEVAEMREQMPEPLRAITTVPAVRDLVYFPFSLLGWLLPERRRREAGVGLDGMVAAPVSTGRRVSDTR